MMQLKVIDIEFSVCKVKDYSGIDLNQEYVFTGATDEEKSLVCPVSLVPDNTTQREDGWRAFRIEGVLDFSLIGILAKISTCLAESGIGIFAISTALCRRSLETPTPSKIHKTTGLFIFFP